MATVNLRDLTRGEVRMLTGRPRGVSARELYKLDELDSKDEIVVIVAPDDLDTVTPSFVQGFLGRSLALRGAASFMKKFDLSRLDSLLAEDFRVGMERLIYRKAAEQPEGLVTWDS